MSGFRLTRAVLKAVTWRVTAFTTTLIVLYALTGRVEFSATAALVLEAVKTVLFVVHEWAWEGRRRCGSTTRTRCGTRSASR